jgi:hypothetical protein
VVRSRFRAALLALGFLLGWSFASGCGSGGARFAFAQPTVLVAAR